MTHQEYLKIMNKEVPADFDLKDAIKKAKEYNSKLEFMKEHNAARARVFDYLGKKFYNYINYCIEEGVGVPDQISIRFDTLRELGLKGDYKENIGPFVYAYCTDNCVVYKIKDLYLDDESLKLQKEYNLC